jgi:16S rRNA G1207 methylase RsmC
MSTMLTTIYHGRQFTSADQNFFPFWDDSNEKENTKKREKKSGMYGRAEVDSGEKLLLTATTRLKLMSQHSLQVFIWFFKKK